MANLNSPRYRRAFIAQQSAFRTAVTTSPKILRIPQNGITMTPIMPKNEPEWMTGTRSRQPAILGRKGASWSINQLQMIPSGTAGTAPDTDILWQSVFGQSGTVVASTSVTYTFLDSGYIPFTLMDFPHGVSTLTNRLIWGCFPTEITFTLNGNFFDGTVRGMGGYLLDSDNFSNEDTTAKAGLASYPTEPSSPTSTGSVIPGFGGTVTVGGVNVESKIQGMTIRLQTGFRIVGDVYSDAYGITAVAGLRTAGISLTFLDDDAAALATIKTNAKSNTSSDIVVTVGTAAGSKCQFTFKSVQLIPQDMRDAGNSDEVQSVFQESNAHASGVSTVDEFSMAWL